MTDNCNPVSQKRAGFCSLPPPPTMKKIINYLPFIALLLLPLFLYPVVDTSGWRSSSDVHAFFEFTSSLLAVTAGIMVLLHFLTTGRWFFLIISIGFTLIGAEQFVHAIFSFNRIWSEIPPTFKLAVSTTWLTGHFILLTSFLIALICEEREIVPAKRVLYAVIYNIIGLICATLIALLIFNSPILPHFVLIGSITKKLIELSLAFLYFIAFLFYSNIYFKQQSHSPLLWSIIAFIVLQVLVHVFVFDSHVFYDALWDIAHLIVLLSYFLPILGVWGETIKLQKSAQVQLIELEKEMAERRKAVAALHRSEENFRRSQDESPLGVRIVTVEGETVYANRTLLDIYDYDSIEALKATPVDKRYTPESYAEFLIRREKRRQDIDAQSEYTINIVRKNGEVRHLQAFRKEILWDGERQYQVLYSDITERKRAEIMQSDLIEKNPMSIQIMDKEGFTLQVNPSHTLLFGSVPPPDFSIFADLQNKGFDEFILLAKKGEVVNFPDIYFNVHNIYSELPDKPVWIRAVLFPLKDIDGHPERFVFMHEDITERKQAEELLRHEKQRFSILTENAPFGMANISKDGNFVYINPKYKEIFGYDLSDIPDGKTWFRKAYPDPEYRHAIISTWVEDLKGTEPGEKRPRVFTVTCKDGTEKIINFIPVQMETGVHIMTCEDITSRKLAEEALHASLQEKELLIREVHHRVKNNMQVMSGLLDLQARSSKDLKLTEMLNESQRRIRTMALIHEKLYESKDFSRIDLAKYVRALSQELFQAYKINPGKIDLVIQTDGAVYVDISKATPCGLILNELISNALKHAFPGDKPGKLEIIIQETKDTEVEILVRDNGLGIPDDVDIRNPQTMGLHLVNGLVTKQLDGQIEVIRDAGTAFRITFPLLFAENKGVIQ